MRITDRIRLSVEVEITHEPEDRELAVARAMKAAKFEIVSGFHPHVVKVRTTGRVHEITDPLCPPNPKPNP